MKSTLYISLLYNYYCTHPVKAYATVAATGKTAEDGKGTESYDRDYERREGRTRTEPHQQVQVYMYDSW